MAIITVREATPEDAADLAHMLDLFDTMGATPDQVAARMLTCQNVLTTFIGELDGQPVGFACLRLIPHLQGDEPYAELTDIYVDAPFRRQGVARALIARVEVAAEQDALDHLGLLAQTDDELACGICGEQPAALADDEVDKGCYSTIQRGTRLGNVSLPSSAHSRFRCWCAPRHSRSAIRSWIGTSSRSVAKQRYRSASS